MGTKEQVFNRKEKKNGSSSEYNRPANQLQKKKKKHLSKTLERAPALSSTPCVLIEQLSLLKSILLALSQSLRVRNPLESRLPSAGPVLEAKMGVPASLVFAMALEIGKLCFVSAAPEGMAQLACGQQTSEFKHAPGRAQAGGKFSPEFRSLTCCKAWWSPWGVPHCLQSGEGNEETACGPHRVVRYTSPGVSPRASVSYSLKHRAKIIEERQLAGLDWGGSCKPAAQESSQLKIHVFVWLRA